MTTNSTEIAYQIAAIAEELTSAMFLYQTCPVASEGRARLLTETELMMEQLRAEFTRLAIAARMETLGATLDDFTQKDQPK